MDEGGGSSEELWSLSWLTLRTSPETLVRLTLQTFSGPLKMSLLGFEEGLDDEPERREQRDATHGDSGTLKVSDTTPRPGDGDHVTLFLGVLEKGLLSRYDPEVEGHWSEVLPGVLRIPFRGLLTGLCFVGVSTTTVFLAEDLKGLPLNTAAARLSVPESILILEGDGVLGVRGVWEVLGVLAVVGALP